MALLAQFGGLMASLLNGFGVIGMLINRELFIGKLVKHLYLIKRPSNQISKNDKLFQSVKFRYKDKLSSYKIICNKLCCCVKNKLINKYIDITLNSNEQLY